jgi:hypothetical protein
MSIIDLDEIFLLTFVILINLIILKNRAIIASKLKNKRLSE